MTNDDSKEMIEAFEELAEAGDGVLAIPPKSEKGRDERDRLMQNYLRQRKDIETK